MTRQTAGTATLVLSWQEFFSSRHWSGYQRSVSSKVKLSCADPGC
jgi:hypothetical protein